MSIEICPETTKKIKSLFDSYCQKESVKPYEEYNPEAIQAIIQVLNILDLEVEGVNKD